jgi:hypothetical protein
MNCSFKIAALAAASCAALSAADGAEIVAIPGDYVFTHQANPGKGYIDIMLQTLVIYNASAESATLTGLQVDILGEGPASVSKSLPVEAALRKTAEFAGMAAAGLSVFLNAQLLNENGLTGVTRGPAALAAGAELAPGDALIVTGQYFAIDFVPATIAVTATFVAANGKIETARRTLTSHAREQTTDYSAPLKGEWLVRATPNIDSHHRYIPSNEFALDFFQTGVNGALDRGERSMSEDDYGYGAPVYAVADGAVVFAHSSEKQDAAALSRRDGETADDAQKRITAYQMRRFSENFRVAAAGNYVVIKHETDGRVEYSSYGHLKTDSVTVKAGDKVKRGEVIGAVGNTGDSTLTHLHFQLNDGPDPFFSRSIPVSFKNTKQIYVGQDPGRFFQFAD